MGTYKDDSDRFHAEREERDRELAKASTAEELAELLEARGVDIDEFLDGMKKVDNALVRLKMDLEFRRKVFMKAIETRLGISTDGGEGNG